MIKIFIVDDHKIVREGLVSILEGFDEFEVVGEADNGKEAVEKINASSKIPDVVLMDINLPVMDGMQATKELLAEHNNLKVVALTMVVQSAYIRKMLEVGAVGYILKSSNREELKKAILKVYDGENYFCKDVTNEVMNQITKIKKKSADTLVHLTKREKEVLELIIKDKSNRQIADTLFISVRTVETHKQNLIAKTGTNSVAGLVVYALKHQLIVTE